MRVREAISVILSTVILLSGCGRKEPYKETRFLMGTYVSIQIPASGGELYKIKDAVNQAFLRMEQIEAKTSVYLENSEVSNLNKLRAGQSAKLTKDTFNIIKEAFYINRLTDGAFDITVRPLVEKWGFGKNEKKGTPDQSEIGDLLSKVGMDKISLSPDGTYTLLQSGVRIDLNALAKGYGVDKAAEVLRENEIEDALIDAGGDIRCMGQGLEGEPWSVGVKHPRNKKRIFTKLDLRNKAIATSGDYEKFRKVKKLHLSHLIDPRTGYPIANDVASVTVVSDRCVEADGLATAITILGPLDGLRLVEGMAGVEAIIVREEKNHLAAYTSDGLSQLEFDL